MPRLHSPHKNVLSHRGNRIAEQRCDPRIDPAAAVPVAVQHRRLRVRGTECLKMRAVGSERIRLPGVSVRFGTVRRSPYQDQIAYSGHRKPEASRVLGGRLENPNILIRRATYDRKGDNEENENDRNPCSHSIAFSIAPPSNLL